MKKDGQISMRLAGTLMEANLFGAVGIHIDINYLASPKPTTNFELEQ